MRDLPRKLQHRSGEQPASLLLKNANLVNVLSGEIYLTDVAVDDGRVMGLGHYDAEKSIDLAGAFLAPSLIDGHFSCREFDADDAGVRASGCAPRHRGSGD
jgi:adenine deaminase